MTTSIRPRSPSEGAPNASESGNPRKRKITPSKRGLSDDGIISTSHSLIQPLPKSSANSITLTDCHLFIDKALSEKRISSQKAARLRACLQSKSLTETIFQLLCEQIPRQRSTNALPSGGGYKCKICMVPLKGHVCSYCPVCSTPEAKFIKDGEHTCLNCPQCFEEGKKRKKLVQVRIGTKSCPHGSGEKEPHISLGNIAAAALIDMRKGVAPK
ncbi:hypothetical protein HJC23_008055 [Cyclotella cryptica]|uniref:Uncharacterized protein n=1 Tax=Cyclotella cryptica TaxID=29204 RepID=A0ABD3NTE8_9STRA|eukprot:CCRYP_019790-RA/>CCRYP_019790-RA protein AED:0.14 eAED:-0.04 QI:0/-1/0/1/-1/1/1/0/213